MPRLHILRLLTLIPLFYLTLIGLWIFLPSPLIPPSRRPHHIQTILTTGQPLITVHADSPSFTYGTYRSNGECTHLAITYRLQPHRSRLFNSLTLHIDNAELNLTDYALQNPPFLDPKPFAISTRAGSTDHIINLPWFAIPDAILFHNTMHGFDATVNLRILVPETGVVEIWKDSAKWKEYGWFSHVADPANTFGRISEMDREGGMLIRLRHVPTTGGNGNGAEMGGVVVEGVMGELTSRTFWVREWMQGPLGPVPTVVMFLVEVVLWPVMVWVVLRVMIGVAAYAVGVLIWWVIVGRPRVSEWAGENVLLLPLRRTLECVGLRSREKKAKRKRRVIWTATGPAYDSDEEGERGNGGNPRGFSKRLDEMLKGVRIRTPSVDKDAEGSGNFRSYSKYG